MVKRRPLKEADDHQAVNGIQHRIKISRATPTSQGYDVAAGSCSWLPGPHPAQRTSPRWTLNDIPALRVRRAHDATAVAHICP